ncbi:MAG: hypothetical protein OEV01_02035 [Nitrospira sp.]|nr:hypothetical protein [Nitrospira sp.]MDH5192615.1 hypothetical protein [Nitrospira sp.]
MDKIVTILGFVVLATYTGPDLSWGNSHRPALPEEEVGSLMPTNTEELIRPALTEEILLQHAEQRSWNWLSLDHTDPHHALGSMPHRPTFSQRFYAPDGAAVMFGWTFDRP